MAERFDEAPDIRELFSEVAAPPSVRTMPVQPGSRENVRQKRWERRSLAAWGSLLLASAGGIAVVGVGLASTALSPRMAKPSVIANSPPIPTMPPSSMSPTLGGHVPVTAKATAPSRLVTPSAVTQPARAGASAMPAATPELNCIATPSSCGFPDATNTGVPAGLNLIAAGPGIPGTTWSGSTLFVTEPDTLIQGISLGPDQSIRVQANNVTIKDVAISTAGSSSSSIYIESQVQATTIEDSTLHGEGTGSSAEAFAVDDLGSSTTILRVDAYNCLYCVNTGGVLKDSYIHGVVNNSSAGAVQGDGSALDVIHNTLINPNGSEDVVFCPNNGCTVSDSLLAGGAYAVYGGNGANGPSGLNDVITGNRFSTEYFPSCGRQGLVVYFSPSAPGNRWSGNVWDGNDAAASA